MNWKRVSLWSGIGGLLFGTAIYAVKKNKSAAPLFADPIPKNLKRMVVELHPQPSEDPDMAGAWTQQCFFCEPTQFYVWSVLPTSRTAGKRGRGVLVSQTRGTQIYFVVPGVRRGKSGEETPGPPELAGEAFYATLRVSPDPPRKPLISQIAREHPLEFRKCLVGGGPNGIETGEILITRQPVLDYRFEMEG